MMPGATRKNTALPTAAVGLRMVTPRFPDHQDGSYGGRAGEPDGTSDTAGVRKAPMSVTRGKSFRTV
jgi:hypothetical protein